MNGAIPDRIRDLERRIASIEADIRSCVRELLVNDDSRYLVMERLPRLGSGVIQPVQEILREEGVDGEVRSMAALVGLEAGDRSVAPILLAEVAGRGSCAPLAARRLAAHGIENTRDAVLGAIRASQRQDVDELVAYLDALRKLGEPLPEDERKRLLAAGEWQVRTAIEEWFPPL